MAILPVAIVQAAPFPLAELDLNEIGQGLASLDTDGHYSRPDVFELSVDTKPKDGVSLGWDGKKVS